MTHWKKLTNPDYLGAYSIEDGKDLILTIAYVRQEKVIGTDGKKEDCTHNNNIIQIIRHFLISYIHRFPPTRATISNAAAVLAII